MHDFLQSINGIQTRLAHHCSSTVWMCSRTTRSALPGFREEEQANRANQFSAKHTNQVSVSSEIPASFYREVDQEGRALALQSADSSRMRERFEPRGHWFEPVASIRLGRTNSSCRLHDIWYLLVFSWLSYGLHLSYSRRHAVRKFKSNRAHVYVEDLGGKE